MKISIPQPCHEKWAHMTPAEQGRFCQNCQKTVVDFTGKTDAAIQKALQQSEGRLCGRFSAHQLNRPLLKPAEPTSATAAWPWLLSTFISLPLAAQVEMNRAATPVKQNECVQKPQGLQQQDPKQMPLVVLQGVLIDTASGEPIPFVNLYIPNGHAGGSTDFDGHFSIEIPKERFNGQDFIEISTVGYERKEARLQDLFDLEPLREEAPFVTTALRLKNDTLALAEDTIALTGEVVILGRVAPYDSSEVPPPPPPLPSEEEKPQGFWSALAAWFKFW